MVQQIVQQLLLAAFGAAGLLLIKSPALSQLSDETSTFTGEVAASCSITGLQNSYEMTFRQSGLRVTTDPFTLTSNVPVSISISYSAIQTPINASPTGIFTAGQSGVGQSTTRSPNQSSAPLEVVRDNNQASVYASVIIYKGSIHDTLPPGDYTYQATISCLQ